MLVEYVWAFLIFFFSSGGESEGLREADAEGHDDDHFEAGGHVEAGNEVDGVEEDEEFGQDVEAADDDPAPCLFEESVSGLPVVAMRIDSRCLRSLQRLR